MAPSILIFLRKNREIFRLFEKRNPALLVGLNLLLGSAAALCWHPIFIFVVLLLLFNSQTLLSVLGKTLLFLAAFVYTHLSYPLPSLPEQGLEGKAYFSLSSIRTHHSPFQRSLVYKGKIASFYSVDGRILHHLPCTLFVPLNEKRPIANCDYFLEGSLKETRRGNYTFKPKKWIAVADTFSWAEWRFRAKERVRIYLKQHIADAKSCSFLTALATGDIEERTLSFEFGRLGLQHILAISGFHFALIAAFSGLLLRLFLPYKVAAALLLIFLGGYFFFLGSSPSILRAWIALSLFLTALLFNLRSFALNALGVGLICELLIDPLSILHIGFQLSFLSTLALLLLNPLTHALCARLLPKRARSVVASMTPLHQHGYLLSAFIRQALALNLAVHLCALPALLYLFHKFPLLSFAYNLFFPLGASLSLFLLLLATPLCFFIPPLGDAIHQLNNLFTSHLLHFTSHPPALLDFFVRIKGLPFSLLIAFLTLLFSAAILFDHQSIKEN